MDLHGGSADNQIFSPNSSSSPKFSKILGMVDQGEDWHYGRIALQDSQILPDELLLVFVDVES